jgi:multiple antibiotic resistance protein
MGHMNVFAISLSLFLLMDPIGNIPFYISFLKGVEPKRQRKIIVRELLIALGIIILFNFIGDALMQFLSIQQDTIQIAGGIILFLLCLKMVFPPPHDGTENLPHTAAEPFIVPLAVPLVAGPGVLAAVMIYAKQTNSWVMVVAILIAWLVSLVILIASSWLKNILGWRGILATERLMGLVLSLIAIEMFLNGVSTFISHLSPK